MTATTEPATNRPQFLSINEAAEYLGVCTTFVYERVYSKELRSFKFGRVHRIRRTDLEEFAASREFRPGETF